MSPREPASPFCKFPGVSTPHQHKPSRKDTSSQRIHLLLLRSQINACQSKTPSVATERLFACGYSLNRCIGKTSCCRSNSSEERSSFSSLRLSESNSHLDNLSCLVCADRQFSILVEWWRKRRRNFGILSFIDSTLPKSWKSGTSCGLKFKAVNATQFEKSLWLPEYTNLIPSHIFLAHKHHGQALPPKLA